MTDTQQGDRATDPDDTDPAVRPETTSAGSAPDAVAGVTMGTSTGSHTDPDGGLPAPVEDAAAPGEFFAGLPVDLQHVLDQAAATVSALKQSFDPAAVRTDVALAYHVLDLLGTSQPLRVLTGKRLREHGLTVHETYARHLTGVDAGPAQAAAQRARDLVGREVTRLRSKRRAEKRTKDDVELRSARREADRLAHITEARDRHRARAEQAVAENRTLRSRVEQLEEDQEETARLLEASRQQVSALRAQLRQAPVLASALIQELDRALGAAPAHPADSTPSSGPLADYAHLTLPDPDALTADSPDHATDEPSGDGPEDGVGEAVSRDDHTGPRRFLRHLRGLLAQLATPLAPRVGVGSERTLKVDVLGGGAEIGGSCVLLTAAGTRILVDCGVRPRGSDAATMRPPGYERALAGDIDAVVITHAHNDHAGWVPALLTERRGVPVYATPATADLLATMWFDSAKVLARNGGDSYTAADVQRSLDAILETTFGNVVTVGDLTLELFPAGHIVGAAGVVVTAGEQRVVVSGDVSAAGQETVGGFTQPTSAQAADLLLLETTYAGDTRRHEPRAKVVKDFFATVERVVDRNGVVLVPAFALGRAQEVALLCARYAPDVPVLIDGLARAVTEVYERHPGPDGRVRDIFSAQVRRVSPGGTNEAARTFRGGVVITTSGMLNQGPAVTWARRVLPDVNSALMVVGYQDEESPGAKLLRLADRGGGQFSLPTQRGLEPESVTVNAEVDRYQLGAHANADELAAIAQRMQARALMPVHGETNSQAQFTLRMRQRSQTVVTPGLWTP